MRLRNWIGTALGCLTLATLSVACSSSANETPKKTPPIPPASGSTGAFGIVTVGGKQKLYLPQESTNEAGHAVLSVVDVGLVGDGVRGVPALIKDIDLGDDQIATASGGDSTVVIAVSTENGRIRFIDPVTDTLTKSIDLDPSYGRSSFSGGGGYITGVVVDSAHHRAIVSVYDGFQLIDLATQTLSTHIQAAPSENFGFDSSRGFIVAPFYDCSSSTNAQGDALTFCDSYKAGDGTPISEGLNLIDLADNQVYTYQNPGAPNAAEPLGGEPDSAAVDPTTGMAVIPSESDDYQNVLDLAHATFDKTNKSFTAPNRKLDGFGYEGVSIETATHLAFWEGEHSSNIAVADLNAPDAGTSAYLLAQMPNLPGDDYFETLGDPHGIAVTSAITNGRAVGVLVSNDRQWVARIDLSTLLSAAPDAGFGGLAGDQTAPAVTYLDARHAPGAPASDGGQ